ncbi:MAG TPA: hypothetical protein VGI86_07465, partial [Acidimicrobiia bacterium]
IDPATMTGRRVWLAAALLGIITAACSSGSGTGTTTSSTAAPSTRAPATTTVRSAAASIDWSALRNPMLRSATSAVKDPALMFAGGVWHALFSDVDTAGHWRIGLATSPDLRHWSAITTMPHDPTIAGEASPDVVPMPSGGWVVTYQSFARDRDGGSPKLYFRTTSDLVHFSAQHPLGLALHPAASDRMIDAAVAYTPAGLLLGYKSGADVQHFEIARSTSGSLDGPWSLVGQPEIRVYGDTIENYQFLHLHGGWQLLATSNLLDRPFLFTLAGDPASPTGWLRWSTGRQLDVPLESWNTGRGVTGSTYEHANCAFIVNRGAVAGEYYLVYSDSPNKATFGGEGPAVLALARSRDLVTWSVPPY